MSRAPKKHAPEEEERVETFDPTEAPVDGDVEALDEPDTLIAEGALEPAEPRHQTPEQTIESLRHERDELAEQLLRRRADFENFRRRVDRDRHTAAQEALAALFRELVGTIDNLERALSASGSEDELRKGVELTRRELVGLLESHGVLPIDPAGEQFDPVHQEALVHEPVPGLADGEVAEVFRKGFLFGERLLRPALVRVAKGEEGDTAEARDEDDAGG